MKKNPRFILRKGKNNGGKHESLLGGGLVLCKRGTRTRLEKKRGGQ